MNWAWTTSLDHIWHSPAFPIWLTLAAAGFFGIVVLFTLLRAEKSVANGALTVITLLAIGIAVAATTRGNGPPAQTVATSDGHSLPQVGAGLPALSCIDDLAGDTVLAACEKALFGSAESVAAAVTYAASQITRLTAFGDVAAAERNMTPELRALRRAVERDRYGLMAQVLLTRDGCTPSECATFRALTDRHLIVANMDERVYDGLVARYSPSWGAPAASTGPVAVLAPSMPTGKPTNIDFPSAASTPPVSIMTQEPAAATGTATATATAPPRPTSPPPTANAPLPSPRPTSAAAAPASALAAAKKQAAPRPSRPAAATAPVQISPPAASAPGGAND